MYGEWGTIQGDEEAKSIMQNAKKEGSAYSRVVAVFFFVLIGLAVWYGYTGNRGVLAAEIIVAAICAAAWTRVPDRDTHAWVLVVEQRVRMIEVSVGAIRADVSEVEARTRHGY